MYDLPFFQPEHRDLAERIRRCARDEIEALADEADAGDTDHATRVGLRCLAEHGFLALLVPDSLGGAARGERPDLRSLCIVREALAASSAAIDSAFAVQGLGSFPVLLGAGADLQRLLLPAVARGEQIAAFALTEPDAGSDVRALATTARRRGDTYVIDGEKTFISNAGIADFYTIFAKIDGSVTPSGQAAIGAFVVDAATPGLTIAERIALVAPHPIGRVVLAGCEVPATRRLGEEQHGLRLALGTLDFFRASVGAAACGLAARGLAEATARARHRRQFGTRLADFQATRLALGDMATELDAARLAVYRAAWVKDRGAARVTRESSMAKLFATEAAQRIVDRAVQLHGGLGVTRGQTVERLYREVRALRIYEGTSEIQRLIIAEQVLQNS